MPLASLLASSDPTVNSQPFITVAIPQYNRRRYLEVNLASLLEQQFLDFEILVSDDHSSDDSNTVIPELLRRSGRAFLYYAQSENLGYDGNVRFCLANARGRYVLMLGNDDALYAENTLGQIADALRALHHPVVAITNFIEWDSSQPVNRVQRTELLGSGPNAAIHYFRSFSFTSGLIFDSAAARQHDTAKWDRSIYYQIYLACRIIASGGDLGAIDVVAVRDHIRIGGELFPGTYRVRLKGAPFSMQARHTGLDSVARVAYDAVASLVAPDQRSRIARRIYQQLLLITYPFWLFEYRRVANWGYAFGVARDLWPRNRLREYSLDTRDSLALWATYLVSTLIGLTVPAVLFNMVRNRIAGVVRRLRQRRIT